ncbi:MAG TPA: protein kinase [Bryobacteraceae bacterium]|jgi:serine/threonine protein kinase|nr:protein kinase [Bryobacteraceae bacterium]
MSGYPENIGPYHVTGKLGEGGMGVVYCAHDSRLDRPVALKMILGSGDDDSGRKRFQREAQSAARVTHPNICRIYDIGEEGGRPFLVMELLEGEPLSSRLMRGPLPVPEAVQIILSVLSALSAIHRCSLVHRDLKPSNVFLSTQGVKVLDFGLAKPVAAPQTSDSATEIDLTQPGAIAATPRYASPEQLTGKPVDARSDLFSTASMLFEMLSGKQAFQGNSQMEIFHAILYESPQALTGSPAALAVNRILNRALAKDPESRFQDADAMAAELRAVMRLEDTSARVEAQSVKRLIVLPFRTLRPDPDTDFLAFSLPEAIAASLTGLSSLVVRSSLAAARYAGGAHNLKEIAQEADIDVVLTGTLLRAGTELRLTTQLVEAPAGTLVWSRASQVELRDIFQLQDTLVRGVVESLALPLTSGERRMLGHDAPANPSAYDLFLRANELDRERKNVLPALDLYEQCVAKDPSYAPAWARLGRARWLSDKYSAGSAEKLAHADNALRRALELNPDLALAHQLYTPIQVDQGRALDALTRLLRRLHISRNEAELFAGLTHVCRYCGLLKASVAAHSEARRLDPGIRTSVVHTYLMLGDYQAALDSSSDNYSFDMPVCLAMLGRVDEAIELLKQNEPPATFRIARLYTTAFRALLEGDREECIRVMDELLVGGSFRDPEGWYYQARQLAYLSEAERALAALSQTVDLGFFCFPAMVRDPWFDPLRANPEFIRILSKAQGLHQEALNAFAAEGGESVLGVREPSSVH